MADTLTFVWTLRNPQARPEHLIVVALSLEEARARGIHSAGTDRDKARCARWIEFLTKSTSHIVLDADTILFIEG